jgi:uncharacterized membrane protein
MLLGQKRRDTTVTTRRRRRAKRPANVIAAVVGVCAIALGVWALVKTGINTDHIFTPTKDVLGLPHTPTLALGKFGTFVIALAGAASFAFGVIVLTDSWSGRVHRWTAADHDSGWVFIAVGAVLVLAAVLPLLVSRRRVQPQEAPAMQPQEAPAMEHEPVPAEPDPAKASTVTNESAQPAPTGAVRPTETTTDARDTDNINTHATS